MDGRVERAREGCDEALGSLIDELSPSLYRFVRRFTADGARADDLVQEAWVRAAGALDRFDPARPFLPWLYRIAANLAISAARRQRRRGEVAFDEGAATAAAGPTGGGPRGAEPGPLARLDRAERSERVRSAVDRLPPLYRAVTVLYYLDDLDLIDVAEALGIPVGTAKVRLHRARALLRGRLGALVDDSDAEPGGRAAPGPGAGSGRRGREAARRPG